MEKTDSDTSSESSEFVATDEMLNLAYDDESTINEEDEVEDTDEINNLKAEGDMPLEELLKLYSNFDRQEVGNSNDCDNSVQNDNSTETVGDQDEEKDVNSPNQRNSSRLWCKDLIESSSNYDSEDDGDYVPLIDSKHFVNAKTRIGDDYQTKIPQIQNELSSQHYLERKYETLLWKSKMSKEASKEFNELLTKYLESYGEISGIKMLRSGTKDDASALYNLMENNYDVKESLENAKNRPVQPSEFPNIMESWSEQECQQFEKGFETHNKNFHLIREQRLKTRSVSEIVEFYYFWKKTPRYEDFIRIYKKDKKKPINQITDYADCLISDSNGIHRERYLLGNWRGVKSEDELHTDKTDDKQSSDQLNKLLGCISSDNRHILEGNWNIINYNTNSNPISNATSNSNGTSDQITSPDKKDASKLINNLSTSPNNSTTTPINVEIDLSSTTA